jgi:hypothetical protein
LKPTDLDGDRTVRIIRVASDKPALDTLDDCAAKVGCSFGIFEVPVQVYYEPVAPLLDWQRYRWGTVSISLHCGHLSVVPLHRLFAYADG